MAMQIRQLNQSQHNSSAFFNKGGNFIFDLQTKRPEFHDYASPTKPHDNRFVHINTDSLVFSKNPKPRIARIKDLPKPSSPKHK